MWAMLWGPQGPPPTTGQKEAVCDPQQRRPIMAVGTQDLTWEPGGMAVTQATLSTFHRAGEDDGQGPGPNAVVALCRHLLSSAAPKSLNGHTTP